MKRSILALALCLALLLAGCGAEEAPPAAPTGPEPTAAAPAPSAAPTPLPTPAADEGERFPYEYSETLADTEDFLLAVTALGVDGKGDWVVHLRLENRSDEIMNFRFLYQSINGLAIDDELSYRVAVGGAQEQRFRIMRGEMEAWGFERPVQWSFTLKVSSAESNREPYFFEELSASPFGEKNAVRYEFMPAPQDVVVMDNDYATVYITGWTQEAGGLSIEYVAVSRCDKPLLLVLPEGRLQLDGSVRLVELRDAFGAYATLMGFIPIKGWTGNAKPQSLELRLALADPTAKGEPILEDSEVAAVVAFP